VIAGCTSDRSFPTALRTSLFLTLLASLALTACRSAFIETTIQNDGPAPIRLIEVDYPSASFGKQSIDAHATWHYHFKIQGSGPVTLTWTDSAGKQHTAAGPVLSEGQQGDLAIVIEASNSVIWKQSLTRPR
jgi:hypothetical protein